MAAIVATSVRRGACTVYLRRFRRVKDIVIFFTIADIPIANRASNCELNPRGGWFVFTRRGSNSLAYRSQDQRKSSPELAEMIANAMRGSEAVPE